jgi:hypothetical protein
VLQPTWAYTNGQPDAKQAAASFEPAIHGEPYSTPASTHLDGSAPFVALAETSRTLPDLDAASGASSSSSGSTQSAATAQSAGDPNLDALARQVYDVLKRRLSVERRLRG